MPGLLLTSLNAIVRGMKTIGVARVVGYAARSSGAASADTYGSAVLWDAKRDPTRIGDVNGKQRTFATWHLYRVAGQTALPTRLGKITDGTDIWHVLEVRRSYAADGQDLKFDCECVLQV